jgi:NAD(P)-dependent dehydrogenase (short-subunit alcohol dehydrogenase family)
MHGKRVALVTGANKGIGFEISRALARQGHTVVIGARDEGRGAKAAGQLREEGLDVHHVRLDVTDAASVAALPPFFEQRFGRLDVLVNNAGVYLDTATPPSGLPLAALRDTFETNVFGVLAVTQALLPLLRRSDAGRIVNLSSTLGSLTVMSDPKGPMAGVNSLAYQASKSALNMLTVTLAKELRGTPIKVNAACPGWVKTDMGGPNAPGTAEQGADTPTWLATLPADGPTGGFFNSRKPVPW